MGKNVAIFVDVANIFYAAKAAGVDIDYVTLLKAATAGRDFVRAYAYTGLDPDNENQRNFHSFLARHGYKVVSKDIRKYGDGKVKANLDIELVVDMMKTARNLDVAIVVSGDGDFAPAIRAVQEMGVRVEVVSFRGNTSSDLIEVADIFTDITQLAKVERGSSRSGRRVAEEEFDMTGTDIPDKQTEGASERARRQRGRRAAEEGRPRESSWARERREAREAREAAPRETVSREPAVAGGPITVMPGEKLSRAPRPTDGDEAGEADEFLDVVIDEEELIEAAGTEGLEPLGEGDEPRRRRRRGGRGRGRGRGRPEDGLEGVAAGPDDGEPEGAPERAPDRAPERAPRPERPMRDLDEDVPVAPRGPRPTPFGSIWDSQLGVPTAPAAAIGPMPDDDEEEPEIPEYLLAERRRGPQGGQMGGRGRPGQGGRGGRQGAYTAAMERERFGRGGLNRYGEPQGTQGTQGSPGRIQSQPQPQGRPQQPRRDDRPHQAPMRAERMPRSDEPWSEVPPEIEEMLRAQMASRGPRPGDRQQPQRDQGRDRQDQPATAGMEGVAGEAASATSAAPAPATGRGRGRPRRTEEPGLAATTVDAASTADAVTSAAEVPGGEPTTAAPRRGRPPRAAALSTPGSTETATPAATETPAKAPATRGRRPATGAAGTTTAAPAASAPAETATAAVPAASAPAEPTAAPRRGRPPKSATAEATGTTEAPAVEAPAAAKPAAARRSRSSAAGTTPEPATSASSAETSGEGATAPAATKRRTTRKATSEPSAE